MKADPGGVLTGVHIMDGDHACCEGALAAGARFAAGYPITPSTEIVERFAARACPTRWVRLRTPIDQPHSPIDEEGVIG
jgi:hypothetical protein